MSNPFRLPAGLTGMPLIDWTQVGLPPLTLHLEREASGHWIAVAQDGETVHARGGLLPVVRWMKAHAEQGHCQVDEESIEREYDAAAKEAVAWLASSGGEPIGVEPVTGSVSQTADTTPAESASPPEYLHPAAAFSFGAVALMDALRDDHSRRVPLADVIELRPKGAA